MRLVRVMYKEYKTQLLTYNKRTQFLLLLVALIIPCGLLLVLVLMKTDKTSKKYINQKWQRLKPILHLKELKSK